MNKRWWHNSVVYQIYPKSFLDTNHDGIGDLNGITEKLDYIKELGTDVIWISPFFQSPMVDNGYDISDYQAIDPQFGSMEDFDNLLKEAKKRDIKILIDLVVNHTSDQHPWFLESKSSLDNPKRDWYIWKNGQKPNNWRSCFGGSVWAYDESTDSSYFHYFDKAQPCLNWENKEVREAIHTMINWWLDKGIGGFRVDAINVIKKAPLEENFPVDAKDGLANAMPGSVNIKGIEVFLQELAEKTFNLYDIMTVAEADVPVEEQALWTGPNGFFDMAFQFNHNKLDIEDGIWHKRRPFSLIEFKKAIAKEQSSLTLDTWAAVWLENHDNPRIISKILGDDSPLVAHKMLSTSYFFLRGTPFIYQGQEIGMRNIQYDDISKYDDIASIDHYQRAIEEGYSKDLALSFVQKRSRDNTRYPMQWDDSAYFGFSDRKPWLDCNTDFPNTTVEKALERKDSLFYYFKEMIRLRKNPRYQDVFSFGTFTLLLEEDPNLFVYQRAYKEDEILVIVNFSNKPQQLDLDCRVELVLLNNIKEANDKKIDHIKAYQALVLKVL